MARPRASKRPATGNQLASLSSEVLRLRLLALNLPVRGSRQQLIAHLKSALKSQATSAGRAMAVRPGRSTRRKGTNTASMSAQPTALNSEHDSVSEGDSLSMEDGSPSLDNIILSLRDCPALPSAVGSVPSPVDTPFSDSQLRVLQQTVQMAVQNARFQQDNTNEHHYSSPPVHPTGMASPLGLQRPLDRSLEEKILRGEYVNFALLLPDSLTHSQAPALQFCLEDSSPGSAGTPITMVCKKKPVVDSFYKWVDAFTTFMLVVVNAYPGAAELITYLQIIRLTWHHHDEQFCCCATHDLSLNWGLVDLELWTITFSGQAKHHCFLCSSPYHC